MGCGEVHDIEDLLTRGHQETFCPFYAEREAQPAAGPPPCPPLPNPRTSNVQIIARLPNSRVHGLPSPPQELYLGTGNTLFVR